MLKLMSHDLKLRMAVKKWTNYWEQMHPNKLSEHFSPLHISHRLFRSFWKQIFFSSFCIRRKLILRKAIKIIV